MACYDDSGNEIPCPDDTPPPPDTPPPDQPPPDQPPAPPDQPPDTPPPGSPGSPGPPTEGGPQPPPGAPPPTTPGATPPGATPPAPAQPPVDWQSNFTNNTWTAGPGGVIQARTQQLINGGMDPGAAYNQANGEFNSPGGIPSGAAGANTGAGGGGGGAGGGANFPGMPTGMSEQDFQDYMKYLNDQAAAEQKRYDTGIAQQQKDLDLRTAIANATQAYQQALIASKNTELAQTAARDAMTRDFQMQDLAYRRQQNATSVDIEREKLDLQRRLLPSARTTRRAATVQTI